MNVLSKNLLEGKLFQRLPKFLLGWWYRIYRSGARLLDEGVGAAYRASYAKKQEIVPNKIVFMTFQNSFTCNPKYIINELLARGLGDELDIVLVVDKKADLSLVPEGVRTVLRGSAESIQELVTAKVWVDNALNCIWIDIPKKEDQLYLNTWHGSLGIKRLDTQTQRHWVDMAHRSNDCIDVMLTNSIFEDNVMHSAYWPDVNCIQVGHARDDLFFDSEEMARLNMRVKQHYGLPQDTRIALYAPTFREDKDVSALNLDCELVREALEDRFGGTWVVMVKYHFHNALAANSLRGESIVNATAYPDIQELMAAADVGITDYSSWIYDFVLTRRPCFLFASDLTAYGDQRGFYYPLQSTPFPLAEESGEVADKIRAFDEERYAREVEKFLDEKGCMEDGNACARIADMIMDFIRTGKKPVGRES